MKKRIIGHPWRARRYEKKIPELRRITYEFIFYQSIWNAELFLEKFNMYGERGKKKARSELKQEHRFLWKILCAVLILLIGYFIRAVV